MYVCVCVCESAWVFPIVGGTCPNDIGGPKSILGDIKYCRSLY